MVLKYLYLAILKFLFLVKISKERIDSENVGPGPTLAMHPAPGGGQDGMREAERARTPLRERCSRREHDNRIVSENDLQNMSDMRQTRERK